MRMLKKTFWIYITLLLVACDITNDFPYPIVQGQITAFEVEGQCAADGGHNYKTAIDPVTRTITLFVCDTVDISNVRVTKIAVAGTSRNPDVHYAEAPRIIPEDKVESFPQEGFDSLTLRQGVRMDFTQPVRFTVRTYQDYVWTVKVARGLMIDIEVENQVGTPIIDADLCNAIIYVKKSQKLDRIKVKKFILSGEHGKVTPDPTAEDTYDFSEVREFTDSTGWGEIKTWRVVAFYKDEAMSNAWSNFAILKAPFEETSLGRYDMSLLWRKEGEVEWGVMPYDSLDVDSVDFYVNAKLKQLQPETSYEYCLCYTNGVDSVYGNLEKFTTEQQLALYNGGFEHWWIDGKVAYPNEQGTSYWDTSNPGGASFGGSNTTETTEVVHSGSKAAKLQSQYIVIKFAAASMYTGSFGQLVGTSGAWLNWGVPFVARPTALKGWMQYAPVPINREGKNLPADAPVKGEMDQCGMYCALLSEPMVVDNTDMSTFPDWNTDSRVVAYGALPIEQCVDSKGQWKEVNIPLVYRNLTTKPTHLLVVFSSSKYGDYFHGGEGSTLYIDDFSFEYGCDPLVMTESTENK